MDILKLCKQQQKNVNNWLYQQKKKLLRDANYFACALHMEEGGWSPTMVKSSGERYLLKYP